MSPGRSTASPRTPPESARLSTEIRLAVEQVSYAYALNPQQAPVFTLEATSFQAKAGEPGFYLKEHKPRRPEPAWQEWQGSVFARVRSSVRSWDGFRSTVLFEHT